MYATWHYITLFLIECLLIWKSKNDEAFSNINHPNWLIVSQILSLYNFKKIIDSPSPMPTPRLLSWRPPPDNTTKVNLMVFWLVTPGRSIFECFVGILWMITSLVLSKFMVILLILVHNFMLFLIYYKSLAIMVLKISFSNDIDSYQERSPTYSSLCSSYW